MEIEYLQKLIEYPAGLDAYGNISFENSPSSTEEILELETLYNSGNPFPKALKELLCLAGEYCFCLQYNPVDPDNNIPTQTYMQESVRKYELPITGLNHTRPFYIIDLVYPGNFRFVYLDVGDDPIVYGLDRNENLSPSDKTLSELILHVIKHTHRLF